MEPRPEIPLEYLGKRHEYGDVYTFVFKPLELAPFEGGQYIHMRVPGVKEGKAVREFSFASAPHETDLWFSMHVRDESPFKIRLAELAPGEEVTIFKIKGDFTYPENETRKVVFIAGGVGITPFRSIIKDRAEKKLPLPAVLVHAASDGYLFQDELQTMPLEQHRIPRTQIEKTLGTVVTEKPGALYYIAGSPFFTVTTEDILQKLGVPQEQIKRDDFDGYDDEA